MKTHFSNRAALLFGLLAVWLAALEGRLFYLQILHHQEWQKMADKYQLTTRVDQSWRGPILDRNGFKLALTVPVKDVYADLSLWSNRVDLLSGLVAPRLRLDPAGLARYVRENLARRQRSSDDQGPGVLLLKRDLSPLEWAPIAEQLARENFGLPVGHLSTRQRALLNDLRHGAVLVRDAQCRYYPEGELLAQVLGFVGAGDDGHWLQGRWGLESCWDPWLAGQNGICVSSQDATGHELAFCRVTNTPVRDGAGMVLTIDLPLQKIVEDALARAVARHHPVSASCVIIRPSTGEILALGIRPTFSPQAPAAGPQECWRNLVISDRREVGSVFKVITLAAALDLGVVNLDRQIFCENGRWVYQKSVLHDDGNSYAWLSVWECLARSSNIGFAKIALLAGPGPFYDAITRFGFTRPTGVPLPYETPGFIRSPTNWTASSITRVAIGQECAVSQLQLAMACAAIANDGVLMHPWLVRELVHADGTPWVRYGPASVGRVVRVETARTVRAAMEFVVESGTGTGTAAALPRHSVAGKTGTAQISDGHHYVPGSYYCSFIGMVPAGKPELVIAVAVDQPKDSAYGGLVAAPVFQEIAAQAVVRFNIPPDKAPVPPRPGGLVGAPIATGGLVAINH